MKTVEINFQTLKIIEMKVKIQNKKTRLLTTMDTQKENLEIKVAQIFN